MNAPCYIGSHQVEKLLTKGQAVEGILEIVTDEDENYFNKF